MIICRKPWTLYDVDLVGAALLVVLVAAGFWLVALPARQAWSAYRQTAASFVAAQRKLEQDAHDVEGFEQQLVTFEDLVAAGMRGVPDPNAFVPRLREMTQAAEAEQVRVLNVAPVPSTLEGAYLVVDVQVTGRGASPAFFRFLDRLARENPYQALRAFTISRPAASAEESCELAWTIRFYLLPAAPLATGVPT
jgi:hypothetical protein